MSTATMIHRPSTQELLARVSEIRPILEQHAAQAEAERRLPASAYDAMIRAGLFRLVAPEKAGGYDMPPVDAYAIWEAVSAIDSAAGWCLQIAAAAAGLAPTLPEAGADEVYREKGADTIFAVPFFPLMAAHAVDGGYRVTGKGRIASGVNRADWIFLMSIEMEGEAPKLDPVSGAPNILAAVVRPGDVTIVDSWNTMGMRGSGSNDVIATDVFVPTHRVGVALGGTPNSYATLGSSLFFFLGTHSETTVSLGVASAAIDRFLEIAATKVPNGQTIPLRERAVAQHHIASARALVDASREFLRVTMTELCAATQAGSVSTDIKVRAQVAACFAAESSAKAVLLIHEAAGTSGVFIDDRLERHLRDALTLTQHTSKSYARYEDAGKVMLGVPTDWAAFIF